MRAPGEAMAGPLGHAFVLLLASGIGGLLIGWAVGAGIRLLRARLVVVTVRGDSMHPTYRDGERVVVLRRAPVAVGDVVVAAMPSGGWMIKRIAAVAGDPLPPVVASSRAPGPDDPLDGLAARVPAGKLVLLGDNAALSTDSRRLGLFGVEQVLGKVLGVRDAPRSCSP